MSAASLTVRLYDPTTMISETQSFPSSLIFVYGKRHAVSFPVRDLALFPVLQMIDDNSGLSYFAGSVPQKNCSLENSH